MRRIVREYVGSSLVRAKPILEDFIKEHLQYPAPFPYHIVDSAVSINEFRRLALRPRFSADYPPVDITAVMRISVSGRTRGRDGDGGLRTFAMDVSLRAVGTVDAHGYDVLPESARVVGWWHG